MAAAAATMAAEEAEEALGLFTGIGLSEAKARETLRNGALSALLRRAVLQVRPPRGRTLVPGPRSPVPCPPPCHLGTQPPWELAVRYQCHLWDPVPRSPGALAPWFLCHPLDSSLPGTLPALPPPDPGRAASALGTPLTPRCCRFAGARAAVLP